jgi:uncharacterized Zn finger protein (UPF0148 family)
MIADCAHCRAEGNRACDECGNPVFRWQVGIVEGRDLCAYCLPADLVPESPMDARLRELERR